MVSPEMIEVAIAGRAIDVFAGLATGFTAGSADRAGVHPTNAITTKRFLRIRDIIVDTPGIRGFL